MRKKIIVLPHNHFDPTWRRCFDRKSRLGDITVASYAEVEEATVDRWIDWGQTFTEGQAAVLRKYLERNPHRTEQIKELIRDGKICVPMTGETVQDNNLPAPEGLIRNYLTAIPFYQAMGVKKEDLKLIWMEDTFGSNPNYPQILKGVGGEAVCKLSYTTPAENVWVGIDGSKVAILDRFYLGFGIGGFEKQPYCLECSGRGCDKCGNTGIDFIKPIGADTIRSVFEHAVNTLKTSEHEMVAIEVGGEELLPESDLGKVIAETSEKYPDIDINYGTMADIYNAVKDKIADVLTRDFDISPDLNPVFSGCYVSRIKIKQKVRKFTYDLLSIESRLANKYWLEEKAGTVPEDIQRAWRLLTFCHFHDAVTGTHIDNAYEEIMDFLNEVESIIGRYISEDKANKTAEDTITIKGICDTGCENVRSVTWGKNKITFDNAGILDIKTDGKELFRTMPYGKIRRPFRIGELCVEQDAGDAWSTRIPSQFSPSNNWNLIPLGDFQRVKKADESCIVWEGKYSGTDYMIRELAWTATMSADSSGLLKFNVKIDWDTDSRRIKALFPVNSFDESAIYEVPFGYIKRKYEPQELNYAAWSPNTMEFPVQNFALQDKIDKISEGCGVAVINRGLPCYRWYPGCFELSLLRSPQCNFCVNEQAHYDFSDISGLRDKGSHEFDYALMPYTDNQSIADISSMAHSFNQTQKINLPFEFSGKAIVTAFKPSENGRGFILRFYNPTDDDCSAGINFGQTVSVCESDLLENPVGENIKCKKTQISLTKFKIMTLYINI